MVQPAANFTVYSSPGLFADVIAIEARHSPHLVEWPIPLILRSPGLAHRAFDPHEFSVRSTEARGELLHTMFNLDLFSWLPFKFSIRLDKYRIEK